MSIWKNPDFSGKNVNPWKPKDSQDSRKKLVPGTIKRAASVTVTSSLGIEAARLQPVRCRHSLRLWWTAVMKWNLKLALQERPARTFQVVRRSRATFATLVNSFRVYQRKTKRCLCYFIAYDTIISFPFSCISIRTHKVILFRFATVQQLLQLYNSFFYNIGRSRFLLQTPWCVRFLLDFRWVIDSSVTPVNSSSSQAATKKIEDWVEKADCPFNLSTYRSHVFVP